MIASPKMLHDLPVDDYLYASVTVTPEAMEEEFVRAPADIAYWNSLSAQAMKAHLLAKWAAEKTEARLKVEMREQLVAEGKKPTESMVDAAVVLHPDMERDKLAAIEAEVEFVRVRGIAKAVSDKKDVLQSLGATYRAEMEGDPMVRQARREARF